MGQRLNIEIKGEDKVLANACYHWGGYTMTAVSMAKEVINDLRRYGTDAAEKFDLLSAVSLLESTGAGFSREEQQRIRSNHLMDGLELTESVDRNFGLIAVSPEGMELARRYEEGRVTIDAVHMTVCFEMLCKISNEKFIMEENKTADDIEALPEYPSYSKDMSFEQFDEFTSFLYDMAGNFFKSQNEIYEIIED